MLKMHDQAFGKPYYTHAANAFSPDLTFLVANLVVSCTTKLVACMQAQPKVCFKKKKFQL